MPSQSTTPPLPEADRQFDFGQNWLGFARKALSESRVTAARSEFSQLHRGLSLENKSFLDIGFGQGMSLLCSAEALARSVGCDINPTCEEALRETRKFYGQLKNEPTVIVGSILNLDVIARLREASPSGDGLYDIVHSWGVLHHTGNMSAALAHAASLVRPDGHLVLAIYNRHWSSAPWWLIKWIYVHSPSWLQTAMVGAFQPVIYMAKWAVTGRNPRNQQRGMDFYFNVVDWVGGYPYEYASIPEMNHLLGKLGFEVRRSVRAEVPTGCNEFVYQRKR